MSNPSNWPLPAASIRYLIPRRIIAELAQHQLSRGLYPLAMGYYCKAAGHRMQRVEHDDFLLIYCIEGAGSVSLEGEQFDVVAGDILLVPQGVWHRYEASPNVPWTIYWVHFHGEQASDFVQHLQGERAGRRVVLKSVGVQAQVTAEFEALLAAQNSRQDLGAHLFAANQLRQILTHIAILSPAVAVSAGRSHCDLEQIHALMQAHLHEQLDLDTLAASVNLSKFHLVKRYKELTGTTPINRFLQLKIERACHLLDSTNISIKEVAYAVGYDDAYYFSRLFRKQLGVSPTHYRLTRTEGFSFLRTQRD